MRPPDRGKAAAAQPLLTSGQADSQSENPTGLRRLANFWQSHQFPLPRQSVPGVTLDCRVIPSLPLILHLFWKSVPND